MFFFSKHFELHLCDIDESYLRDICIIKVGASKNVSLVNNEICIQYTYTATNICKYL